MRKRKGLMLGTALLTGTLAFGDTFTDGNGLVWTYTVKSGNATLSGVAKQDGTTLDGALEIPGAVNGSTVTAIAADSFKELAITSLTISDSVTTIGAGAFSGCSSLKNASLGNGLVTIGNGATGQIDSGANTVNPDTHAGKGAFGNCVNLEEVTFGANLQKIGDHAFSECHALKALTFPDSVQRIGINTFYDNIRLTSIIFGANLQTIDKNAFMGCVSLSSVTFSPATTPLLTIKSNAFKNCVQLASLTLSNAMPTLESGAFSGCTMLRRITIPSLMSTLQNGVFSGMTNLKEVTFLGLPPENLANAGLATDVKIRYSKEYAEDWAEAIAACGFTNVTEYDPNTGILPSPDPTPVSEDPRYELAATPADRSIASISVESDCAIDSFVLTDGKVYDTALRIVNTSDNAVRLTLPTGYTYECFKGMSPLTIPAKSTSMLTITRTADNVFLVAREELETVQ